MNTCECVNPPGGTANCSDDQLAVCVVEDGVAHAYCITVPHDELAANRAYFDANNFLAQYSPRQRAAVLNSLHPDVFVPASSASIANFVLAIIKAESRNPDQKISREDSNLLLAGEYRIGDRIIRFRIPHNFRLTSPSRMGPVRDRPITRARS